MLKRIFFVISALILVATAIGANKAHAHPLCDNLYEYSFAAMMGKQYGLPIERALEAIARGNPPQVLRPYYIAIVRDAYTYQTQNTEEMKDAAINQYAADWYFLCMEKSGAIYE